MHMLSSIADMGPPFYTPTVYTADFWSPLLTTLYLAGIGSLSWMLQRRTPAWGTWGKLSMARGVIVVLLLDSCVSSSFGCRGRRRARGMRGS